MTALLTSVWPMILAFLVGVAGVVFGLFKRQSTKIATAQLATANAKADDQGNQASAARADAQATTDALDKVQAAGTQRAQIDATVAAAPTGEARKELQNEYGRD